MTQIFTGTGLGLHGSSLGQLGSYGPKGSARLGQGGESVSVNAATGNVVLQQSDGFLSTQGFGFNIVQTYNSRGEGVGGGWRFNTDSRLSVEGAPNSDGSVVKRIDEDGHCTRFTYDVRERIYRADDGTTGRLSWGNGTWTYREGNASTCWRYDAQGQLSDLSDRDGHLLRFSYEHGRLTRITDTSGTQQVIWTFKQGYLQDVTWLSENQTVNHLHYEYDKHNRLITVMRDLGQGKRYWISYAYLNDSNLIRAICQSDGTDLKLDYDAQGRIRCLEDGEGRRTTYEYGEGQTQVTNGLGESWIYFYDQEARLTGIDGPENLHIRYAYEGKQLSQITQGTLHWQFAYTAQGDCIRIEAPGGAVTLRSYDKEHNLLSQTQYSSFDGEEHPQKPCTTRFIYDEAQHLRFEIAADGTLTEYGYNSEGLCISRRCYLRARIDTSERLFSEEELRHWCGQHAQQDTSLIEYRYDWRGNRSEELHYTALDAHGNGVNETALKTYTRFDAQGRLVEKSLRAEDGSLCTTHYFYDGLGRLIKTIDNQKHEQSIEYDEAHHRIISTDAHGLKTISTYDQGGLLLSTQRIDRSEHDYGTSHYQYDAAGRLIKETAVDGQSTYWFYDPQGRLQAKVRGSGQATEYQYDAEGRCIQTRHVQHTMDVRPFKDTMPQWSTIAPPSSAQDRISKTVYNACNQIAYQVDSEGAVIGYRYDAQGHVLSKTAYANRLRSPGSTPQECSEDRSINYYYDAAGRLQAEINAEGSVTAYRYDNEGHLLERRCYANRAQEPRSGDWSRDAPKTHHSDRCSRSIYNAAGLNIADIDAGGYLTEYRYDGRGLLTETIAYDTKLQSLPNDDHSLESIRPKSHPNDHRSTYVYNDLNQLIEEHSHSNLVRTYAYNEQGLVISTRSTDTITHEARGRYTRYDALGRVIQSLDELGVAKLQQNTATCLDDIEAIWQQHGIRYTYDNAGHLLSKTNALNQTTRYFYNDAGLLIYTLSATGAITETRYTVFEQVETSIRYAAVWQGGAAQASTEALAAYLKTKADARFDEVTHFEYNTLGLLISKRQGSNEALTHRYNAFAEVEHTTNSSGIITDYQYDRRGLLSARTEDVGGINRQYFAHYDVFGRIEQAIDGRNHSTSYQYNQRGELIRLEHAGQEQKTMTYDAFGRILSLNGPNETLTRYDEANNTLTLIQANGVTLITQFNAFGDKISVTDGQQNSTRYHYDAKGQLIHTEMPEHRSMDYEYDSEGHLIFQCNAGKHSIRYTFDAEGRVLTQTTDPEGLHLTTSYTYDGVGRQLQVLENGRCTQFRYDEQGNLIQKCIDPEGLNLITEFSYSDTGLLTRQTTHNPQGSNHVIAYEWDALGRRVATLIDPDGLRLKTTYEYDKNDNLISQTDAKQHKTQYLYDANNRLSYQVDARGVVTELIYDAKGNKIQSTTYAIRVETLTTADDGALIMQRDSADVQQFFGYDELGRLSLSYDGLGYATEYGYDANNNLMTQTRYATALSLNVLSTGQRRRPSLSADDRTIRFVYDGLNQQRAQIAANGAVTQWDYDASGHVIKKTRFANLLAANASLDTLQTNAACDQSIQYRYDAAGRLQFEASAAGVVSAYRYDEAGNRIATTQYAEQLTDAQRALSDWPSQIKASPNDRSTHSFFDSAGREIQRISPAGQSIYRTFDAVGNVLSERRQAAEPFARYRYDAAGRLLEKTDALNHSTRYTYDQANNVASKTEANHALWTYHYNEANQLIETHAPVTPFSRYQEGALVNETRAIITRNEYDSFGNLITVIRDAGGLNQTIEYRYDAANRKSATLYPNRWVHTANQGPSTARQDALKTLSETYCYNAFGELMEQCDKAGGVQRFRYDKDGHLLCHINALHSASYYEYDAFANVTQKSTEDRHEYYEYTQDNRLMQRRGDEVFAYDARSNRCYQAAPTTQWSYNAFGECIQEALRLNESEWAITRTYYSNEGLKSATLDAEGYLTTYLYNERGLLETETQYATRASGDVRHYQVPPSSNKDRTVVLSYNVLGQMTRKTLKQVAYQRLSGSGYEALIADASSDYSYDAMGNVVCTRDALGNEVSCSYNEFGQLSLKVGAQAKAGRPVTSYRFDALGQLLETRQWAEGSKGVSNNDLISTTVYDVDGRIVQQTDGNGHSIYSSYDANGNLARSWQVFTQADGSQLLQDKRYCYDAENRLTQSATFKADGSQATEDMAYNALGEVIAKGINGRMSTHIEYDKLGRVWRSNLHGSTQVYRYDLSEQVTQIISASNAVNANHEDQGLDLAGLSLEFIAGNEALFQRQSMTFDALGRLLSQSSNQITTQQQELDRWGNVLRHTNAKGYTTLYEYNAFDQGLLQKLPEVKVVDSQGIAHYLAPEVHFAYDLLGRAIAMTDANGHTRSKVLDAEGRIVQETDALGAHRDKEYDVLGRMSRSINERGAEITYTYDKANRLLSISTPKPGQTGAKTSRYEYDEAGQLIKQMDALGTATTYRYDALGHQISRTQGITATKAGFSSVYEYDDAGHKTKEIDANGATQSWRYDDAGRILSHTDLGGHQTEYRYSSNGLLLSEKSSSGKQLEYYYNAEGQCTRVEDKAWHERIDYHYDVLGNLIQKDSARANAWALEEDRYEYDALGRLSSVRRYIPEKARETLAMEYEYDAVGNIRDANVGLIYTGGQYIGHRDYYLYDANDRVLVSKGELLNGQIQVTQNQGSIMNYDEAGNLIVAAKYEDKRLAVYHYRYSTDNLLTQVFKDGIQFQSKVYDDAGQVTCEFLFDNQGKFSQKNIMNYAQGRLVSQLTTDGKLNVTSRSYSTYDNAGNVVMLVSQSFDKAQITLTQTHHYNYELWDSYQQKVDLVIVAGHHKTKYGQSTRHYDVNGQLYCVIDQKTDVNGANNTTEYVMSAIDGIRARKDQEGITTYLNAAGKTLGDFREEKNKSPKLEVYGGFTPTGEPEHPGLVDYFMRKHHDWSKKKMDAYFKGYEGQALKNKEAGSLPDAPQNNLGAYTLHAGDTLEHVALQVYGDSSLWYLIADANGITERNAHAGELGGPLHIGQRINLPPAASLHHNSSTHKVMGSSDWMGNTSATAKLPAPPNHWFKRALVNMVLAVALVAIAGTLALTCHVAGVAASQSIWSAGAALLSGSCSMSASLSIGFTAGYLSHVVSQASSVLLGLQGSIKYWDALYAGVATAASVGVGHLLQGMGAFKSLRESLKEASNSLFNASNATTMMARDAVNQGINRTRGYGFDWKELAVQGITGGLIGQETWGEKGLAALGKYGGQSSILASEVQALAHGSMDALAHGNSLNAGQILTDNLGSAVGDGLVEAAQALEFCPINTDQKENEELAILRKIVKDEAYFEKRAQVRAEAISAWEASRESGESEGLEQGENASLVVKDEAPHKEKLHSDLAKASVSDTTNKRRLGSVAVEGETGRKPHEYLYSVGSVSDGKGDAGGPSYGSYQLASIDPKHPKEDASVQTFLKKEGAAWADEFKGLDPRQVNGPFKDKWKAIAKSQAEDFFNAQHAYIYRENYTRCTDYILEKTGLDIKKQPHAIQEAVWSASVQHGNAKSFLVDAINSVRIDRSKSGYSVALINAMYDHRIAYVLRNNVSSASNMIKNRYPMERQLCLDILKAS